MNDISINIILIYFFKHDNSQKILLYQHFLKIIIMFALNFFKHKTTTLSLIKASL